MTDMQRRWIDHAVWLHEYVVAAIDERVDAAEVAGRLLKSPVAVGKAFEKLCGRAGGRRLTKVLKEHVALAIDLVDAAVGEDRPRYDELERAWDANGREFERVMAEVKPEWRRRGVVEMWRQLSVSTKAMLTARLEENYDHEVAAMDQLLDAVCEFSDAIAA